MGKKYLADCGKKRIIINLQTKKVLSDKVLLVWSEPMVFFGEDK